MSDEIQTDQAASHAFIERKLRGAWIKERRFHHTRGLCYAAVWVVALILVDLLVDWLFLASYRVPGWGRLALLGINAAVLIWVLYHYWWRYLRGYDPVRLSLQVERKHPELKSLLVSYVQMTDMLVAETHASRGLVRAVRREAAATTRPMDFREIVSFNTLAKLLVFSAAVLGLFGAIGAYKTEFFRTLIRRMLNPVLHLEYPTRTVIERVTGNATVRQGGDWTLTAVCSGDIPRDGTLRMKADGGTWEKLTLLPADAPRPAGEFAYRFPEVTRSFEYYVQLGDDQSDRYRVTVIPAPKVVAKQIILKFPDHTHQPVRDHDSYFIEVPEGTRITWRLTLDRAVDSAGMVINGADTLDMTVKQGGRTVERTLTAWKTFEYQFRWKPAGHPFVYTSAMPFVVNTIGDDQPAVEITQPLQDEKATVRKTLSVTFRAVDDHGLARAHLVYTLDPGGEKDARRWEIGPLSGDSVTHSFSKKLVELIPDLAEDTVVTYWIEVADNDPGRPADKALTTTAPAQLTGGPNVGRSQKRRLYIVSIVEYLRGILEERLRWISEVEELRGEEKTAKGEVDTMKKTTPPPATQPTAP